MVHSSPLILNIQLYTQEHYKMCNDWLYKCLTDFIDSYLKFIGFIFEQYSLFNTPQVGLLL